MIVLITTICFIEALRSIVDYFIIKLQRKLNLSNNRNEKLAYSFSCIIYYTIGSIYSISYFSWNYLFSITQARSQIYFFEKFWFISQIGFWFSSVVRNLQKLFVKFTKNIDNDYSATPLVYFFFFIYGYASHYASAAMVLITLHYLTDIIYHSVGIFWIFGLKGMCQLAFRVWTFSFIGMRLIIFEWSNNLDDYLFRCICGIISIWLTWSFIVLQLAKLGLVESTRNFKNSGEISLKTPRLFRPWLKKKTSVRLLKLKRK